MMLTIQLFAAAKNLARTGIITVSLNEGATVAALRQELAKLAPALIELLPRCAIAVNHEFAADEVILKAADEIAVIPPVSGG